MTLHLARIVCTILFVSTYYTSVQAGANNFTAKPVRLGDNLITILRQQGFTEKDREKVLASHAGLRSLFLTLDTRYLVLRDKNDVELRMFDSQTSDAFKIQKKNGVVTAAAYQPNFKVEMTRIQGKIHGSILGSVLSKINSNWVATRFTDAYAFDIKSSKDIRRGANYWFLVAKQYEMGQFVKYGEVTQTSLEINGQVVYKKFIRHKDGGVFFNDQDLLENRPFFSPVNYIKIASTFQPNRMHPITRRLQPHLGVDFELPVGEPVQAARAGVVIRYGNNHAAGNYIVLMHSNGIETAYNHLHKIDRKIRSGLKVSAGEKIAEVGCTGYCTRAHLHFAVKMRGRMVNPMNYIKPYPRSMQAMLEARVAQN